MRRAFRTTPTKRIAGHEKWAFRARQSLAGLTFGDLTHQNTRPRLSNYAACLVHTQTHPVDENGTNASKFSRLVGLVEDTATDEQTVDVTSYNHQIGTIREAFRNAPLFSSAAHEFVESAVNPQAITDGSSELIPQYGLVGALQAVDSNNLTTHKAEIQDRLVLANLHVPWSTFICGSQGSGKSHTLTCLLENLLINQEAGVETGEDTGPSIGRLQHPLAAMMFHYDNFTGSTTTQLCEAAYLCSSGKVPVTILVAPSNLWAMRRLYHNLPGLPPDAPRPRVLPLYLSDSQLTISRILKMMAVDVTAAGPGSGPLYMDLVRSIIREMAMDGGGFTYTRFRERLKVQNWIKGQAGPLDMRLQLLESFMEPNTLWTRSTRPAASLEAAWDFQPGSLTIVDLSDPFLSSEDACVLFSIALSIFMEERTRCGRVVAMDEAHKFLTQTGEARRLTDDLTSIIRQQRHTGTRVMISTQEPTLSPKLIDLSDTTFVHRFLSPAWFTTLQNHLAGAHSASRHSNGTTASSHDKWLFDNIVGLRTGEALVFSPTAHLTVASGHQDGPASSLSAVRPLGNGFAKLRVRRRITADGGRSVTADQAGAGESPALAATDEVPMFVVEARERAPKKKEKLPSAPKQKEKEKAPSAKKGKGKLPSDKKPPKFLTEAEVQEQIPHVLPHLNAMLPRILSKVDPKAPRLPEKPTRKVLHRLEKKFGIHVDHLGKFPPLYDYAQRILGQPLETIRNQLAQGGLQEPGDRDEDVVLEEESKIEAVSGIKGADGMN